MYQDILLHNSISQTQQSIRTLFYPHQFLESKKSEKEIDLVDYSSFFFYPNGSVVPMQNSFSPNEGVPWGAFLFFLFTFNIYFIF